MFHDYRILFLFIIPIVLNIIFLSRARDGSDWRYFRDSGTSSDFRWWEAFVSFVLFIGVLAGMWYLGRDRRINNFNEQIGGFVTQHYTQDGDHQQPYDCNCYTDKDGNQHCSTCYRTVYHRDFFVLNNTGDWWSGSKWEDRVDKPSENSEPYHIPPYYAETYVGKPVSLDHSYPNYIAAMNENVYRNTYDGLVESGMQDICTDKPDYRMSETSVLKIIPFGFVKDSAIYNLVYSWNFYNGDPSAYVNTNYQDPNAIPMYADTIFGYLGPPVQGDVHVYVVNSVDARYADLCLAKWKNGAKNSIYVFIFGQSDGSTTFLPSNAVVAVGVDGTKKNTGLQFANESERSNYYMKYDMRNQLLDYFQKGGGLDRESVLRIIFNNVSTKFVRQEMADFKALKQYVYPTTGWLWLIAIVAAVVDTVVHFMFANNDQ